MKFQIISLLFSLFAIAACSGGSGSGSGAAQPDVNIETLSTKSFNSTKTLSSNEYDQVISGWQSHCPAGFDPNSVGATYQIEESLFTLTLNFSRQFSEQVTVANGSEMHSNLVYQSLSFGGFSGPVFSDNRSARDCKFSSGDNGTSLDCSENGNYTPAAIEYLKNIPKDPEEQCSSSDNWKNVQATYEQGFYTFDNGMRVPALIEKQKNTYTTVCNGQSQQRTITYVEIKTNGVKTYPDNDHSCATTLFEHQVRQDGNGGMQINHTRQFHLAPLK